MSEVKVNKISPRSGTGVQLGDSGDTITIPAGANATLGGAGSTISIPAGATITNSGTAAGFGATGAASWETTVKTSTFTAVAGVGYFVNTTGGVVSVNLPAGTAGAVVAIKDYAKTFDTNACTLVQNGSDKIGSSTTNAVLSTEGIAVTLVFVDSTQGWLVTDDGNQSAAATASYICASVSGSCNTITESGDFKIATFKGPGTFTVNSVGNAEGSNSIDYLIVGAGGGAGGDAGGAAGAGGVRFTNSTFTNGGPSSPRNNPAGVPVSAQGYPISIGAGGSGTGPGNATGDGANGGASTAFSITSAGGGFGGGGGGTENGGPGGSGGGGRSNASAPNPGIGNTPPVSPSQGMNGGSSGAGCPIGGGGGGGFIVVGTQGSGPGPGHGGPGGSGGGFPAAAFGPANGQENTATGPAAPGTPDGFRYFAGGGHGGTISGCLGPTPANNGALGGGGVVSAYPNPGGAGLANMGGGGSGGSANDAGGGAGGSGIVVIRYKFQN